MTLAPYRILVTGSRMWPFSSLVAQALDNVALLVAAHREIVVVQGECDPRTPEGEIVPWAQAADWDGQLFGADWHAHVHALRMGWTSEGHPAKWRLYGRSAGMRRNADMVALGAETCLGFPLGDSPGTKGCLKLAIDANIPVHSYALPWT